jgi:hypothetical protein
LKKIKEKPKQMIIYCFFGFVVPLLSCFLMSSDATSTVDAFLGMGMGAARYVKALFSIGFFLLIIPFNIFMRSVHENVYNHELHAELKDRFENELLCKA